MGCFSWLCKECGKGIRSSSFDGELCRLYWLENGKVRQEMRGQYDSYGRVFNDDNSDSYVWTNGPEPVLSGTNPFDKELEHSRHQRGHGPRQDPWHHIVKLDCDENQKHSGIAAIHERCFKGVIPVEKSEGDPNQGWGDDLELMAVTEGDYD